MLTLYIRTGCGFCASVLRTIEELGLADVQIKDIVNMELIQELEAHTGRHTVPFLIDSVRGVEMYESVDINRYLQEHYGTGTNKAENEESNTPQICTLES